MIYYRLSRPGYNKPLASDIVLLSVQPLNDFPAKQGGTTFSW